MTAPDSFDPRQYWETRLRRDFDLAGVGYLRLGRQFNRWMYRIRAAVFQRVATGLEVDWTRARVADVGAGTGFYVDQWHRLGVPAGGVTGFDLTEKAVTELRVAWPGDRFERCDIGGLTEPPVRDLEAVSAMDVLFHIVDDAAYARAFRNLAAMLRPGGWLIWSDNFVHHEAERVAHQASRPLMESERAVREAGFEIVGRVPMFVLMNYPADTRSRLPRLAWTAMVAPAALAEPLGWLVGALLYPIETLLTRGKRESPTTEIMVCRRTDSLSTS